MKQSLCNLVTGNIFSIDKSMRKNEFTKHSFTLFPLNLIYLPTFPQHILNHSVFIKTSSRCLLYQSVNKFFGRKMCCTNLKKHFNCEFIGFRIILMIFKIMGLAPYTIRRSLRSELSRNSNLQSLLLAVSRPSCFYNLFLVILQIGMLFFSMPMIYETTYFGKNKLTLIYDFLSCIFDNIVLLTTWLIITFRQKTFVELFNSLSDLGGTTDFLEQQNDPNWSRFFFLFLCFTNISTWAILVITENLSDQTSLLTWFNTVIPNFILTWFTFQYSLMIKLIEKYFRAINRALRQYRPLPSSVFNVSRSLFLARDITAMERRIIQIQILKRAHSNLHEIVKRIVNYYSVPILVTIASFSFNLLYCTYYFMTGLGASEDDISDYRQANSVMWLAVEIFPIVVLTTAVEKVLKQTRETKDIVSKLIIDTNSNRNANIVLKDFFLELLHSKLEFTACSIFPLDGRLMNSILSMVMSYVVILIQLGTAKP